MIAAAHPVAGDLETALAERRIAPRSKSSSTATSVDCIDFDALFGLEQLLWWLLDLRGVEDPGAELATALIVDAVTCAARDPASYFPVSPPPGITEAEVKAVERDDACPFCTMEANHTAFLADPATAAAEAAHTAELVQLFESEARAWRAEHAEVLERRGLRLTVSAH